jgi:hypothetical protein
MIFAIANKASDRVPAPSATWDAELINIRQQNCFGIHRNQNFLLSITVIFLARG